MQAAYEERQEAFAEAAAVAATQEATERERAVDAAWPIEDGRVQ